MDPKTARFWSPQREHEFQTFMAFDPNVRDWRNSFQRQYGEAPQINGGNFDYRGAYMTGDRPQPVPSDPVPHWGSVGKTAGHPTAWKQTFMTQFGVDPDVVMQSGQTTPEMQQFINDQLRRDMIANALMRGGNDAGPR